MKNQTPTIRASEKYTKPSSPNTFRPTRGLGVRPGIYRCGAGVIRSPTKPAPISPDRPIPKIVSARPDATWLTARPSAIAAKIKNTRVPAIIPQIEPTRIEPLSHAPPKPQAAPTIIMPSTPRFRTPERSATSSPVAAINSGVEAASTERMIASASPTGHLSRSGNEPEAVEDQGIAGQHVEQQKTLEDLGDIERDLHRDLRLFTADKGECEEKACN